MNKHLLRALLGSLLLFAALGLGQTKPEIHVTPDHVRSGAWVMLTGTGFTPNKSVVSYMKHPDGTEYHPLRFPTDAHGEFSHKIDTVMMTDNGVYEVWVEDAVLGAAGNHAKFRVDYP